MSTEEEPASFRDDTRLALTSTAADKGPLHLKVIFSLSYENAVAVPMTFFGACFLFARVSAHIVQRLGYKRTMVCALLTMGVGALCFVPATILQQFWLFPCAVGVLAAGVTALQVAAAPYVSFLGAPAQAPSRFSLALAFNSLGTMAAPLFGSWVLLRHHVIERTSSGLAHGTVFADRNHSLRQIQTSYLGISVVLGLVAWGLAVSRLPLLAVPSVQQPEEGEHVLRHRPLRFGAITIFLYAGAEIGIGSFLINYLCLPNIGGMQPRTAALFVSLYWGGATLGRFLGWRVLRHYRVETVLTLCGAGGASLLLVSVLTHGIVAVVAVLAIGLCNAMIVPVVVMIAIAGLGARTARASSVIVAANIGAAVVPLAIGLAADRFGLHRAYLLPVISYAFVVFYAVNGSRGHLSNPIRAIRQ
jgi:FHS family L-fucose permease-like MFS transporter